MDWIWNSTTADHVPAASVSPERSDGVRVPAQRGDEAFNLIEVLALRSGSWKAVCECGEAPEQFEDEPAAWRWITGHHCPVLETDTRPTWP